MRNTLKQIIRRQPVLLLLGLYFCSASLSFGAEISPTPHNSPGPISEQIDPIVPANQLNQSDLSDPIQGKTNQKKGWLDWLTDMSCKPANFHYIDFIELFHTSEVQSLNESDTRAS